MIKFNVKQNALFLKTINLLLQSFEILFGYFSVPQNQVKTCLVNECTKSILSHHRMMIVKRF